MGKPIQKYLVLAISLHKMQSTIFDKFKFLFYLHLSYMQGSETRLVCVQSGMFNLGSRVLTSALKPF